MKGKRYSRRQFLSGMGATVFVPTILVSWKEKEGEVSFVNLIDGDILHAGDGVVKDGKLTFEVKVAGPPKRSIEINNVKAHYKDGFYRAGITLSGYENDIVAIDKRAKKEQRIKVFWVPDLLNKYRLSIDDAIWFLRDLNVNAELYDSLFDNPFLGFMRTLNTKYGTKVHINLFYQTDHFNLSQMTDKYKAEWKANSHWLRLSFHAWSEFPDNPYINASYAKVKQECSGVMEQIRRFAGEEVMGPVTTLHWGEVPVEVSRALRDLGYVGQLCDFNVDNDLPPTSYYLDVEKRRHMNKRFVWRDNKEGISFIKSSIIIDTVKLGNIPVVLDSYEKASHKPPYVDLLVHEQYFYPFYSSYQADYRQKVTKAVEWAVEKGYSPAFLDECLFGE